MNKNMSLSKLEEPPLFLLALAVMSLVINLCFPQYSAMASNKKQKFDKEVSLNSNITVSTIKEEIEKSQNSSEIETGNVEESYSELKTESQEYKNIKVVTVTAYSSTVDQCDSTPFITASGSHVRDGIIATNALAFGTKVQFPSVFGDKVFVVEDRMNARYTDRADIWFETREEALQFGIRTLEMVIL